MKLNIGQDSLFYVCTDRQGSITALLKQNGAVSERYSYDAWGRRRNPTNWNDYNVKAPRLISRGYTGHEQLDGFGLINMNGRMYDPVIGRVLSPDKFVQAPGYTQSYNRYSYCMNNPLRYTDPSGNQWALATQPDKVVVGDFTFDFMGAVNWHSNPTGASDGGGGGYGASFYTGGTIYSPKETEVLGPNGFVMVPNKDVSVLYKRVYGVATINGYFNSFYKKGWEQVIPGIAQPGGGVDLTSKFNQRIVDMMATFSAVGNTMDGLFGGPILSYGAKIAAFGSIQYKGAKTEFMNPKAFKSSPFYRGGIYKGEYFSADDFGNYAYGVAARAMGLLPTDAIQGAGLYSIFSNSPTTDWTNFIGYFDEKKDTIMIIRGYYGN